MSRVSKLARRRLLPGGGDKQGLGWAQRRVRADCLRAESLDKAGDVK